MRSADVARANGWTVGTVLAGSDDGFGTVTMVITAIGEHIVAGRAIERRGEPVTDTEHTWFFEAREWTVVKPEPSPADPPAVVMARSLEEWHDEWAGEPFTYTYLAAMQVAAVNTAGWQVVNVTTLRHIADDIRHGHFPEAIAALCRLAGDPYDNTEENP